MMLTGVGVCLDGRGLQPMLAQRDMPQRMERQVQQQMTSGNTGPGAK